ncbi:amidohydrolase family protein [Streptomyces sp. SID13031]|uniref:amidohydrolase family protein n=1 Tax=Streptomyces sp. SID13031 TaxID=2706046 RepID=UPI0013CC11B8|nr:amidohydrolase family protein [Streptomyces sp. SID13031]NEA31009.1 amidohydrolase family protein [Streptomyces sp. SID13031]
MIAIAADGVFDGEQYSGGGVMVVVDGERIVSVGPAGTAPPGGELIRFDGCTVLPGLIDAHVHLCCNGELGALPGAVIGLVDGGVSLTAALSTATLHAATALSLPGKGRLSPGSDADLLVVLGNPANDIIALRTPQAVYLRGIRAH